MKLSLPCSVCGAFHQWSETECRKIRNHEPELQKRYESDERFRKLADKIHHARLMDGPACTQCMAMAERQLA